MILLLFMNLKYHIAREAISGLIGAPRSATGHRDALRRGQVRAQQHRAINTLIGPITVLIEPSISALIARITPLIVWINVLIGTAIKTLIAPITALIVWINVLIGLAIKTLIAWISVLIELAISFLIGLSERVISMVIGVMQEGNGPIRGIGNPAVGCELVEDARDLAGASKASPAGKRAHAWRERFALCQALGDGVEHQGNRRRRDELIGS